MTLQFTQHSNAEIKTFADGFDQFDRITSTNRCKSIHKSIRFQNVCWRDETEKLEAKKKKQQVEIVTNKQMHRIWVHV